MLATSAPRAPEMSPLIRLPREIVTITASPTTASMKNSGEPNRSTICTRTGAMAIRNSPPRMEPMPEAVAETEIAVTASPCFASG
jgi:hypothetical protein